MSRIVGRGRLRGVTRLSERARTLSDRSALDALHSDAVSLEESGEPFVLASRAPPRRADETDRSRQGGRATGAGLGRDDLELLDKPAVAVSNMSNVYGEIPRPFNQSSPGLPFLGLFDSAEGCQAACKARSNCTQYSWGLDVQQFELHCFGRCDNIWRLHPVPSQYTVVAARRVHAGPDGGSGGSASLISPSGGEYW